MQLSSQLLPSLCGYTSSARPCLRGGMAKTMQLLRTGARRRARSGSQHQRRARPRRDPQSRRRPASPPAARSSAALPEGSGQLLFNRQVSSAVIVHARTCGRGGRLRVHAWRLACRRGYRRGGQYRSGCAERQDSGNYDCSTNTHDSSVAFSRGQAPWLDGPASQGGVSSSCRSISRLSAIAAAAPAIIKYSREEKSTPK
jgi:hypothetical protein